MLQRTPVELFFHRLIKWCWIIVAAFFGFSPIWKDEMPEHEHKRFFPRRTGANGKKYRFVPCEIALFALVALGPSIGIVF